MRGKIKLQVLVCSLILVAIPAFIFPRHAGMALAEGWALNILFEMAFYALILFLMRHDISMTVIALGVGLVLIYRLTLGAAFGLLLIMAYGLRGYDALILGMAKYMPAVIIHAIAAPFVLRPVFLGLADNLVSTKKSVKMTSRPKITSEGYTPEKYMTMTDPKMKPAVSVAKQDDIGTGLPNRSSKKFEVRTYSGGENQFDRAVAYVGELAAVRMALLIDNEGLTVARFSRGQEDVEHWAPMANLLEKSNRLMFDRFENKEDLEKIDICTKNLRLICRRIDHVILMILAEQSIDETIHIRLAQAADMVRKHMTERYNPGLFARAEEHYVSNS